MILTYEGQIFSVKDKKCWTNISLYIFLSVAFTLFIFQSFYHNLLYAIYLSIYLSLFLTIVLFLTIFFFLFFFFLFSFYLSSFSFLSLHSFPVSFYSHELFKRLVLSLPLYLPPSFSLPLPPPSLSLCDTLAHWFFKFISYKYLCLFLIQFLTILMIFLSLILSSSSLFLSIYLSIYLLLYFSFILLEKLITNEWSGVTNSAWTTQEVRE